jgi:cysteine synthase
LVLHILDEDLIKRPQDILGTESLYLSVSSALNVVAACKPAQEFGLGMTVTTIICDRAYKYQGRPFSREWLDPEAQRPWFDR